MISPRPWMIVAAALHVSTGACAQEPFTASPVAVPGASSALDLVHRDRAQSGGFSALWLSGDCTTLITLSDYSQVEAESLDRPVRRSGWVQATIIYDDRGKLRGLAEIRHGQLRDTDGRIIQGAAESMVWDGEGFLVSFDDRGDIYRYAGRSPDGALLDGTADLAIPQGFLGKGNAGLEAVSVLRNGRVFTLWEKTQETPEANGRILDADGAAMPFTYLAAANPGAATTLRDGSVLILERDYLGPGKGVRLRLVRLLEILLEAPARPLAGEVLFDQTSTEYDNFEGVSACRRAGREWAFVISDDNGDWPEAWVEKQNRKRQRTLLLMIDITALTKAPPTTQ